MLVPVETREHREIKEVIAELKQFGRSRKLPAGVTVRDLIEEGRRF